MPEEIECSDCEDGAYFEDTSYQCSVYPIGDCCGGCGYMKKCETCDGTGKVEPEENEE
jgi:hypothetical protein